MVKKLLSTLLLCFVVTGWAAAQTGTISGKVVDSESGESLPGVNIVLTEIQRGVATDGNGEFSITDVDFGTYTLRASFVGYKVYQEQINLNQSQYEVRIELVSDAQQLEDVVVTAFGLDRETKSVGYAVQEVGGDDLSMVKDQNIVGSLSGKVAGVQVISAAGAAIGGSDKIRLRGVNGLTDGQPLFVVDGVPINNRSFSAEAVGRDYGNLASDLNMDNIESVSVLKGAAASAMYGSRASNGVILITTKKGGSGDGSVGVSYSNNTSFDQVSILPNYQNEYAGGYTQDFIQYTDPVDGQTYNGLNYAADESWGPRMDDQEYRPWWSWYHGDFDGDGTDDYGKTAKLSPRPDNVRNFFESGVKVDNSLAIEGGNERSAYRLSVSNTMQQGVMPNSELSKNYLNFNGSLQVTDRLTSSINFNYVNTAGKGRPAQGYSVAQGNPIQSFNQWFQRQLDMSKLKNYRLEDGSLASWNIRSHTNTRPLYWDSPYFTVNENVAEDERDRVYGNFTLSYQVMDNLEVTGTIQTDFYDFIVEDRIASGGLEQDWYQMVKRSRQENNYQLHLDYQEDFDDISFNGFLGGNIRTEDYNLSAQSTVGGLSTANFYNIDASKDRPNVTTLREEKEVRSVYGTASIGWKDMVYVEATGRNDWSSALPANDNSNFYYGLSGSLVFTELGPLQGNDILSFGKIRASIAQVGDEIDPYQIASTYEVMTPYGSNPAMDVPETLNNPTLTASVSTDYELGLDMRFLQGRVGFDVNVYQSVREDEILQLQVSPASGYEEVTINAGEFVSEGVEVSLDGALVETRDFRADLTVNWATSTSRVEKLAEGLTSRNLENAYFGVGLFAREGQELGTIVTQGGYGGYATDDQGRNLINPNNGHYALESNKELGNLLPDWTGGTRLDISYKNFDFGAFFEFQKGGQFYSVSKMFNAYSGLGEKTVGDNVLGNPLRDPISGSGGVPGYYVPLENADPNSGGVLVEGVDDNGNEVKHLYDAATHFIYQFYNKENWIYDASYIKLREVKLSYNLPQEWLANLPVQRASVGAFAKNVALLYASTGGVDPSSIQNGTTGFSFWEGAGLPPTRSIGFNVNLKF
ncbi:MAG: SusC/RagA family TonB-linked outer membrane protein [Bacteroidota bacterium]